MKTLILVLASCLFGIFSQAQTSAPLNEPPLNPSIPMNTPMQQSPNWMGTYDTYQTYPIDESRMTGSSTMTGSTMSLDNSRSTGSSTGSTATDLNQGSLNQAPTGVNPRVNPMPATPGMNTVPTTTMPRR